MADVPYPCAMDGPPAIPGYHLLGKIGEGGTGEVHRATQLSLQRTVAVKLLSPLDGVETTRLALERESRAMASLAHPHVVTVHDCGRIEERWYLVMEYVDGSTLRHQLEPGKPLPPDRAARVLDAIAQALSYIHEQGILHLDLKPENVLVTSSGTIKITDFGLAAPHVSARKPKAMDQCQGTLDYCSPEQRYGLPVDRRSDVFSLATLAYELLTGHLPSRVYVPASERNARLPRAVNAVLRKGLARDAEDRYDTPEAFRQGLLRSLGMGPRRARRGPGPSAWVAAAAALLFGLLLASGWSGSHDAPLATHQSPDPIGSLLRLSPFGGEYELLYPCLLTGSSNLFQLHPSGSTPVNLNRDDKRYTFPAYSPDGSRIAFCSDRDGGQDIYVMDADGGNVRRLTQEGGSYRGPAWSPDGKRIAFTSWRDDIQEIYVMDADGSNEVNLTNRPRFNADPAWSPDGKQIVYVSQRAGRLCLLVMDQDGSYVRDLNAEISPQGYVYPAWSPDGKRIIYGGAGESAPDMELFVCDPAGTEHQQLTRLGGLNGLPAWSPDGKRIAFQHVARGEQIASLYVMNADGTGAAVVLAAAGLKEGGRPAWKPR